MSDDQKDIAKKEDMDKKVDKSEADTEKTCEPEIVEDKGMDEQDVILLKAYGRDMYRDAIDQVQRDIVKLQESISKKTGVKEASTGLAHPSLWDFAADKQLAREPSLRVGRVTSILPRGKLGPTDEPSPVWYVVAFKNSVKYVTNLHKYVAPVDITEGTRVGVSSATYQIRLPLAPSVARAVKMMEVEEKPDVTYADIGGCKEQIEKLREVIELPLLDMKRFARLGLEPPRGALLTGPPGMGKTLCARAVANRADACFIRVIGSELAQRYVGQGAQLVRDLFAYARTKTACIIFFDEIDAIGQTRIGTAEFGDNEVGRTLMELIVQLDGFDPRGNIKVLMATNRGDTLDPALMRPGRLDRKVEFGPPDYKGRIEIFKIHASKMSVDRKIRYDLLARMCPSTSGADIRSICTEAGMYAIRERKKVIGEREFLRAIEKVVRTDKKFNALSRYLTHN